MSHSNGGYVGTFLKVALIPSTLEGDLPKCKVNANVEANTQSLG